MTTGGAGARIGIGHRGGQRSIPDVGLWGGLRAAHAPGRPRKVQPLARAIGGSGDGAAPGGAPDDFRGEVKDCHDGNPSTPPSARRHDV